jgi:hypothetical protein
MEAEPEEAQELTYDELFAHEGTLDEAEATGRSSAPLVSEIGYVKVEACSIYWPDTPAGCDSHCWENAAAALPCCVLLVLPTQLGHTPNGTADTRPVSGLHVVCFRNT